MRDSPTRQIRANKIRTLNSAAAAAARVKGLKGLYRMKNACCARRLTFPRVRAYVRTYVRGCVRERVRVHATHEIAPPSLEATFAVPTRTSCSFDFIRRMGTAYN